MNRKDGLPAGMYLKHGAYWLVRKGKWTRLSSDLGSALSAYLGLTSDNSLGSMDSLLEEAMLARAPSMRASTLYRYRSLQERIREAFAEFKPEQVKPVHIVRFLSTFRSMPNTGNHALSVMKLAFNHALERGIVESNPAVGLKRFKEAKRDRLLTPNEVSLILRCAEPQMRCIILLLVLTGQRVGDILSLPRSAIREDGILVIAKKTGKRVLIEWTPALRDAVARSKALGGPVKALTLFCNPRGRAPHYSAIWAEWDATIRRAGVEDARIHDLRAYAATVADSQGRDATALLGHSSPVTTARYLRDKKLKLVQGPSLPGLDSDLDTIRQTLAPSMSYEAR